MDEADYTESEGFDRLEAFGYTLQTKVDKRIADRQSIEDRWLNDLRQYHGKNADDEDDRLKKAKKSRVFVNITRNKCNAAESRLIDLLFPTDDKNWGISPTPDPKMESAADQIQEFMQGQPGGMQSQPEGMQPQGPSPLPGQQQKDPREEIKEAKKKSDAMETEIEDQLVEANYAAESRDMIHDAVVFGTGVIKGPNVVNRTRKKWQQMDGMSVLEIVEDLQPGVCRVSPWNFFPDLNAKSIDTAVDVFERKRLNKKQLQDLAKHPGYLREQLRKVIIEDTEGIHAATDNLDQVRDISGAPNVERTGMYDVWEYHGPVDREDLIAAGLEEDEIEDDPLISPQAIIVFCNKHILKASLNPLETEEMPYSVFCWEEDESSVFGYGVSYRMRSPQKVINAAWRMLMDNAAISVGPQVVMDKESVEPADGKWEITGRKLWYKTEQAQSVRDGFGLFEISSHQPELTDIFMRARQLADEETNLPVIAQGEQTENITQTARGMSMLMQSANTVLRRAVRSYDDNVTDPLITRFYDWNMQNSEKEEIKGDFSVKARGSAELAERALMEQGIQDLVAIASSPAFAQMTDMREMYRRICKAKKVDPDGLIKPESEMQEQETPPEIKLEVEKLKLEQQKFKQNSELEEAKIQQKAQYDQAKLAQDRELGMAKIASQQEITLEQLRTKLGMEKDKMDQERELAGAKNMTTLAGVEQKEKELMFKQQSGRQGI